ncbi:MAG TPA: prepilin-type N-terminal cleavage/methylation domain-containing protein [Candidatus Didemnitutus sp.]|nr:prepilin-type N-terminal cleavage/methylation domain-containing protein [Candidatus Didemnitutus sp.]
MRSARYRSVAAAFTLVEVLVSLAILVGAAVVLGASYVNTLNAHHAVALRAAAGHEIDYLRDAILNEPDRETVEKGGTVTLPDNRRLQWDAAIEEAVVPDLFKVTVRGQIAGTSATDHDSFEETMMLLRPTWSDPQKREQQRTEWAKRIEDSRKP